MPHQRIAKKLRAGSPLTLKQIEQNLKSLRKTTVAAIDYAIKAVHQRMQLEAALKKATKRPKKDT